MPQGAGRTRSRIVALYAATLLRRRHSAEDLEHTRNEKKLEEQERLLVEARLAALTSQINPHFLFNTLNSVSSLIRTDPDQARVMVVKLSKVLRRLLRKHENFTPLRDELSFIDDYLSIEVTRFGDKLRFEKEVAEDTLDMLVPSMLLQPLVENSHQARAEPARWKAAPFGSAPTAATPAQLVGGGRWRRNLGGEAGHAAGPRIGVSNVNERLKVLFGSEYRMWIDSQPGCGTRIQIEVPELQTDLAAV